MAAALAIVVGFGLLGLGIAGLLNVGPLAPTSTSVLPPASSVRPAGPTPGLSPTPSLTLSAAPTVAPTSTAAPSPTVDRVALVNALYARLVPAVRAPDVATLMTLLHPATIERYGEAGCRAYFSGLRDPAFNIVARSVGAPAPWIWERDGRSTTIADAWAVEVDLTSQGATSTQETHVAPVAGEARWFTDCGNPVGT